MTTTCAIVSVRWMRRVMLMYHKLVLTGSRHAQHLYLIPQVLHVSNSSPRSLWLGPVTRASLASTTLAVLHLVCDWSCCRGLPLRDFTSAWAIVRSLPPTAHILPFGPMPRGGFVMLSSLRPAKVKTQSRVVERLVEACLGALPWEMPDRVSAVTYLFAASPNPGQK